MFVMEPQQKLLRLQKIIDNIDNIPFFNTNTRTLSKDDECNI